MLMLALSIPLSAQDVYKGRKFFGGYFYINSDALKDILIDGDNTDSFGKEYWNNSPFDKKQARDVQTRGKMRFDLRYGYFPMDEFAIGGDFIASSSSYNEEDTIFSMQNKSLDLMAGPFVRYYIEIGAQPYEIGAIFIEGSYNYGIGKSEDDFKWRINDSIIFKQHFNHTYNISVIKAKLGFSWYLSDFISHNWFTGYLLALEPSIAYHWTTKKDKIDLGNRVMKSRGLTFSVGLFAYF